MNRRHCYDYECQTMLYAAIAASIVLIVALLAYQLVHAGPWPYNLSESPVERSE